MDQTNVGNMNGYYQRNYSADDMRRMTDIHGHDPLMGTMDSNGMDPSGMISGTTLDQMIQNDKELNRRRSFHNSQPFLGNRPFQDHDPPRSAALMEFGSQDMSDLDGYQFDPMPHTSTDSLQRSGSLAQRRHENQRTRRNHSSDDLCLDTNFSNMGTPFSPMQASSPYQTMNSSQSMTYDMYGNPMQQNMMMGMDFSAMGLDNGTNGGLANRHPYSANSFPSGLSSSPMQNELSDQMGGQIHDPGGGVHVPNTMDMQEMMGKMMDVQMPEQQISPKPPNGLSQPPHHMSSMQQQAQSQPPVVSVPEPMTETKVSATSTAPPNLDVSADPNGMPIEANSSGAQQVIPQYRNAYSASGFDMMGVLMRVATRPNPQINIGAVDMSCAFVVCDVQQHDCPIVYCSDVFERLTAYTKHEILGRNCRFLQAPDGKIKSGVKRKYVDDQSVLRIKKMITAQQETQISLINYRKGGQPFMNLLTMIPIRWDTDEVRYYVGFQVDLVEQPSSLTNKNPDGSYMVNYNRSMLPRYIIPDSQNHSNSELGQTVHRDDVSTVLTTIGSGESELSKRIWDKMLLENTDDVVHVLSLKGLFLYLSPSSRKVLEYDPAELVGTALSSVCHPSDIVPVTRELKDTSSGAAVNVVFRIRRKHSGYTWFESHGSLHLEQGKGRKCIIMVGRERPVYALARNDVEAVGGIGESELWTKMSTSGMFLYVSSNVRSLLDRQPEDLVGTSAQGLMREDSKVEFGKQLELARTGVKVTFKHDVQNKRGQTLQARTILYPGDATEGQKPTFLLAQTRLLKMARNLNRQSSNISPKTEQKSGSPASSNSHASGGPTPTSASGNPPEQGVTTQAGGSGLVIGTQHEALASEENVFDELKTTRSTSWQFELRQMEKRNRLLAEELQSLLSSKKKRKRRNGAGNMQKDCVNCHTRVTPEWRRGPSGNRDLCNSCGLRWAKENGRVTPRTSSQYSDKSGSPHHTGPTLPAKESPQQQQQQQPPPQQQLHSQQQQQQAQQQQQMHLQDHYHHHNQNPHPHQQPLEPQPPLSPRSPQNMNANSHNAKIARMEADPSRGFGGGIPAKIEEGVE